MLSLSSHDRQPWTTARSLHGVSDFPLLPLTLNQVSLKLQTCSIPPYHKAGLHVVNSLETGDAVMTNPGSFNKFSVPRVRRIGDNIGKCRQISEMTALWNTRSTMRHWEQIPSCVPKVSAKQSMLTEPSSLALPSNYIRCLKHFQIIYCLLASKDEKSFLNVFF